MLRPAKTGASEVASTTRQGTGALDEEDGSAKPGRAKLTGGQGSQETGN
jgi:hypothetical protein